ncbi:hypothetical protein GCT13_01830 [Paraburkholderia sp. CNPSo 3157]|uniref:Uncharacterized protein n=1 Tax=Paraburkholderia franconis TaxID=2654983 RepID=A0A7X1N5E8_9BURK|nr:hypothetical protein [Paraburkholderia franconis]MPW15684.1 hypothetical protein [Paraburkholderia franconis]
MIFDALYAWQAVGRGQDRAARSFRFDDTPTMDDTVADDEVLPRKGRGSNIRLRQLDGRLLD